MSSRIDDWSGVSRKVNCWYGATLRDNPLLPTASTRRHRYVTIEQEISFELRAKTSFDSLFYTASLILLADNGSLRHILLCCCNPNVSLPGRIVRVTSHSLPRPPNSFDTRMSDCA
jgi:hypothetical protein